MSDIGRKIIDEIRKVVEREPNFVFKDLCHYVVGGAPACLIGHGLWNAGLIDGEFESSHYNDEIVATAFRVLRIEVDDDELLWLRTVQKLQDKQHSWGSAIEQADAELKARAA